MADANRTEPSTPKKRRETREKGEVARSVEISAGVNLFVGLSAACLLTGIFFRRFQDLAAQTLGALDRIPLGDAGWQELLQGTLAQASLMLLPVLVAVGLATALANYLQVGFQVATKAITPKWEKLNPINGCKRLFSMRSWMELLKSAVKIACVALIVAMVLRAGLPRLIAGLPGPFVANLAAGGALVWEIVWKTGLFFLAVGALDLLWQRHDFDKKLRMTKQEVRDEYRQTEGDAQVKSRRRAWHRRLVSTRVAAEVARADVVTTNPTHYAVALKYEASRMRAPRVVAKGERLWAKLIVSLARKHRVPVVENKPLTRALYHQVEIGQEIPPTLYRAVAEVLAALVRLRARRRTS